MKEWMRTNVLKTDKYNSIYKELSKIKTTILKVIPDKLYLEIMYKNRMGKKLTLKDPKTFNEKLQWLKLYNRKDEYSIMVDKYLSKQYVGNLIGKEYIIPTIGRWDRFEDIDFTSLPDRFVLKCNHDSGSVILVDNKSEFDKKKAQKSFSRALSINCYWSGREWPYKNVKPCIIAEAYMEDCTSGSLRDYKFYCFDGIPKFLYVSEGLENHSTAKISFLTCDWQFAPYQRSDYKPFEKLPSKPSKFNEMFSIAGKLSTGHPFLRVDLYEINGSVYFSELTFFPCGGFMPFKNPEHDAEIGRMLHLPTEACD